MGPVEEAKGIDTMHTEDTELAGKDKERVEEPDVDEDEQYSVAEQRKIIHKVDRRLLIILGLMQAVSFLDRANLSNAAIAGMYEDLGLAIGNRYSVIILVFFAPYVILQFPASVLVRKLGARWFISTIVLCWGIVMICFAFASNWVVLIPLRMLLGAFEAGCFPSQYYLISSWYSRYDLYKRTSVFYLIGVLGSAAGGALGYAFSRMAGLANYDGWKWIFIMEGLLTCLVGLSGYVFLVNFPDQAHKAWAFLTEPETAFILRRIDRDRQDAEPEKFSFRRFVLLPASDLKIWGFAMLFMCSTIQAYSVGYFMPIILKGELGFSEAAAQGLSSPPYVAAMLLMFVESVISDRYRLRFPVLLFNACLTIAGLCLLVWGPTAGVQYFGAILIAAGCSANLPAVMVFQANNIRGTWKRAFSSASMISFGGTGGVIGSLVFRSQDAPKYLPGIYTCLTANGIIILLTTSMVIYFAIRNRRARDGLCVNEGLPGFQYTL